MAVAPRPDPETVAMLLDTTWRVAQSERDFTDSLDSKAALLATFSAVVLSLLATLSSERVRDSPHAVELVLLTSSLVALVATTGLAVSVLLPKERLTLGMDYLERFPSWSEVLTERAQVETKTMRGLLVALAREREVNSAKARAVRAAFRVLFLGLLLVAAESILLLAREVVL